MKSSNDHLKSHKKNYNQPSQTQHYYQQYPGFQMFNQNVQYIPNSPNQVNKNLPQDYNSNMYQYINIQNQQIYNASQKQYGSPETKKKGKKNSTANLPVQQQHVEISHVYGSQNNGNTHHNVTFSTADPGAAYLRNPTKPFLCFNILKRGTLPGISFSLQI